MPACGGRSAPGSPPAPSASGVQNLINRHEDDPAYAPWGEEESFDSLLSTPVMLDGRCVAVLEIASRPMNQFDHSDEALMTAVAEQLAAALRGVRLRNESERRAQRLALTAVRREAVASADTARDVLRAAVDAIFEPTDYGAVTAILALPDSDEHLVVTDRVRVGASIEGSRRPIHHGAAGRALETGEQIVVGHLADPEEAPPRPSPTSRRWSRPCFDGTTIAALALYDHRAEPVRLLRRHADADGGRAGRRGPARRAPARRVRAAHRSGSR